MVAAPRTVGCRGLATGWIREGRGSLTDRSNRLGRARTPARHYPFTLERLRHAGLLSCRASGGVGVVLVSRQWLLGKGARSGCRNPAFASRELSRGAVSVDRLTIGGAFLCAGGVATLRVRRTSHRACLQYGMSGSHRCDEGGRQCRPTRPGARRSLRHRATKQVASRYDLIELYVERRSHDRPTATVAPICGPARSFMTVRQRHMDAFPIRLARAVAGVERPAGDRRRSADDTRSLPVVVGCNGSRCGSGYRLGVHHQMRSGKAVAFSEARSERWGRADVSKLAGALGLGRSQARLAAHAVRLDQ